MIALHIDYAVGQNPWTFVRRRAGTDRQSPRGARRPARRSHRKRVENGDSNGLFVSVAAAPVCDPKDNRCREAWQTTGIQEQRDPPQWSKVPSGIDERPEREEKPTNKRNPGGGMRTCDPSRKDHPVQGRDVCACTKQDDCENASNHEYGFRHGAGVIGGAPGGGRSGGGGGSAGVGTYRRWPRRPLTNPSGPKP